MTIKFGSSGDAFLTYSTAFSMYITLWKVERQTDTILLLLYYFDFIYIAQYVCIKVKCLWERNYGDNHDNEVTNDTDSDVSFGESLPLVTTPISLLPFHTVFRIGLDLGYFYQFVCFLRFLSLYQQRRIYFDDKKTSSIKFDPTKGQFESLKLFYFSEKVVRKQNRFAIVFKKTRVPTAISCYPVIYSIITHILCPFLSSCRKNKCPRHATTGTNTTKRKQ